MDVAETFRFLLALALVPLIFGVGRRISMARARTPFLIGFSAILASFAAGVVLRSWLPGDFWVRFVMHMAYMVGGLGMAWAAWEARRYALEAQVTYR